MSTNERRGDLGNGTFLNPILAGDYADPSVLRVGEDFYMTHSSFVFSPGLLIWHSKDLVNWEPISKALENFVGDIWAPDFIYHEDSGLYYIYVPIDGKLMVLFAPSPLGPWSFPIDLNVRGIDPGHITDKNGDRYLYYGSGNMILLSKDGLSTIGESRKIYNGWDFPDEWVVEGHFLESPKLTFHNGYYYLTAAQGGTSGPSTSHMVISARSRSPIGPFENSPYNPIIRTKNRDDRWCSRGHGTLINTQNGDWWIVYHAYEKDYYTLGRQTMLEPIEWTEDGWFRVPSGVSPEQAINKPSGVTVHHGFNFNNFITNTGVLGLQWSYYKQQHSNPPIIKEKEIILSASPEFRPLVCMPEHHSYEAYVEIEIENGSEGQLLLFYNEIIYSGIGFSKEGIYGIIRGWHTPAKATSHQILTVRLINKNHEAVFYYRADVGPWIKLQHSFETSGWHHNALGGYLALRIGLNAKGDGNVTFKNFVYQSLEG